MAKQLKFSNDARQSLLKGIDAVAKAVVTTLGPKGRNIALDKKWGSPSIVHDGVSVAREIDLPDPFENMGAQLAKEAANKTNDNSGDGTTTSTLIASTLVTEGMKALLTGINPMELKKEIEEAVSKIVNFIEKESKPVTTKEEILRVASVSAQDGKIGQLIADAIEKVGKDGAVTVEEGRGLGLEIEYKEGMEFDRGYASPYLITDSETMESEIQEPYILITDKKISNLEEFVGFLNKFVQTSKNLVVVADDFDEQVLAVMVVNKLKGALNILAIKAPEFGDRRREVLEDIATLTGGTVLSQDTGQTLEGLEIENLGRADKVWADKDTFRIIGGRGEKKAINARIVSIKAQIKETNSDFDREKLEERLAKLSGGLAQINVGAATEIELNDRKERVKDAVGATKAAIEEGIVAGGGAFLFEAREVLPTAGTQRMHERGFSKLGHAVVYNALGLPLKKILENAYGDIEAGRVISRITDRLEKNIKRFTDDRGRIDFDENYKFLNEGYDVLKNIQGNMLGLGIIDPAKVVKSALQNAASVATMVLTTEGLVTDIPEEKKETPAPGGGMEY